MSLAELQTAAQPNFNCLKLVAEIEFEPLQGHATHTKP